ncbi:MAG: ATP-binding cassette domain-containing protein [Evtepia gabavorous]
MGPPAWKVHLPAVPEPAGDPHQGSITFDGTEITDPKVDIDRIRRQMGMVFQHFNLFPNMTIRRTSPWPRFRRGLMKQAQADQQAMELLRRVGLEDKADSYPNQPGGQKQRIAIVRALAMKPKLMLFGDYLRPDQDGGRGAERDEAVGPGGHDHGWWSPWMGFAREVGDRVLFMADGKCGGEYPCGDFSHPGRTDKAFLQSALRKREPLCRAAAERLFAWGPARAGAVVVLPTPLERQGGALQAETYFFEEIGKEQGEGGPLGALFSGGRNGGRWFVR